MKKLCAFVSSIAFLLTSCSTITTKDYANNKPTLDLRKFLKGPLEAWGIVYDMNGKADVQFHVAMNGTWKGNVGKLEERFVYSDGRKDERIWTMRFSDDHHFTATAHDVIGEAKGTQHGNTVN